jgi:hypothetical protein
MLRWNNVGPMERRKSNRKKKSVKMWYWLRHGTGCYSNRKYLRHHVVFNATITHCQKQPPLEDQSDLINNGHTIDPFSDDCIVPPAPISMK